MQAERKTIQIVLFFRRQLVLFFDDNINNLRGNQIAPQKASFFGDPALLAALKEKYHETILLHYCGIVSL